MGRSLLFVCLLYACQRPTIPRWASKLGYSAEELSPVALDGFGIPTVRVLINDQPVTLEFDTGNMSGIAISPVLADELRIEPTEKTTTYDSSGVEAGDAAVYQLSQVSAFGDAWEGKRAVGLPRDDISGLLGPEYLLGQRFTLDYRTRQLAVSASPLPASAPGEKLPLIWSDRFPGMPVVRGYVNGVSVLIQLDTGKSRTCVDPALARQLDLASNAGGFRIDHLVVGSFTFTVPSAKEVGFGGFSAAYPEPILIGVGSDVLSQVLLTIDYISRQCILTRHLAPDPA